MKLPKVLLQQSAQLILEHSSMSENTHSCKHIHSIYSNILADASLTWPKHRPIEILLLQLLDSHKVAEKRSHVTQCQKHSNLQFLSQWWPQQEIKLFTFLSMHNRSCRKPCFQTINRKGKGKGKGAETWYSAFLWEPPPRSAHITKNNTVFPYTHTCIRERYKPCLLSA